MVPSTALQENVLRTVAVLAARKLRRREGSSVTTRELTGELGRVGQVVGHSCGELVRKRLLTREAPSTYRLTRAALDWLQS